MQQAKTSTAELTIATEVFCLVEAELKRSAVAVDKDCFDGGCGIVCHSVVA